MRASVIASSALAEPGRREISDRINLAGETCSRFKERTRSISFSERKSDEPRRRSLVLAGGPKSEKRSLMAAITTEVKGLLQESPVGPNRGAKDQQTEHRQSEFEHGIGAQRLARHTLPHVSAGTDPAFFQEAVVVTLEQESFDLPHGVQDNAHGDQ